MISPVARRRVIARRSDPVARLAADDVSFRAAPENIIHAAARPTTPIAPITFVPPHRPPSAPQTGVAIVPFPRQALAPDRSPDTAHATTTPDARPVVVVMCLALLVAALSSTGVVHATATAAARTAQASATSDAAAPPRLQAVGEGNAIVSGPVEGTSSGDERNDTGWYRVAIGIAVAALILFGLFQRRQNDTPRGPDRPAGGRRTTTGRAVTH